MNSKALRCAGPFLAMLLAAGGAHAVQVSVVGLFKDRAMVSINGGKPRMVVAGQTTPEGVRLVSANARQAVMEIEGQTRVMTLGQSAGPQPSPAERQAIHMTADANGHFVTVGSIDGTSLRFLVDTGASVVAINAAEARRLGLRYQEAERVSVATANGVVAGYRVTFNSVKLGDITLHQVQGMVVDTSMPVALLGMSFLNRVDMKREGSTMTLSRRF